MRNFMYLQLLIVLILGFTSCRPPIARNSFSQMKLEHASYAKGSNFTVINGKRIHYRISGKGPAILMLPGALDTLHTFGPITKLLERDFTVIRIDVPGFGFSDPLDWDKDIFVEQILFQIEEFMTIKGFRKYHILGNSLGGFLSWMYAVTFPEKVDKTILLDPAGFKQDIPTYMDLTQAHKRMISKVFGGIIPMKEKSLSLKNYLLGPVENEVFVNKQISRMIDIFQTRENVDKYIDFLTLYTTYKFNHEQYIKELNPKKTLLVFGEKDTIIPFNKHLPLWKRDVPGINYWMIKNGGHAPHWEVPTKLSKRIKKFLKN